MGQLTRFGWTVGLLVAASACTAAKNDDSPSNTPGGSGGVPGMMTGSGGAAAPSGSGGGGPAMMTAGGSGMTAGSGGAGGTAGTTPTGSGGATVDPDAGIVGFIDAGPPADLGALPDDPGERGPWPVGVKTAHVDIGGGMMTVEVWYPAQPGSDVGQPKVRYDLRTFLPHGTSGTEAVPDEAATYADCNCVRDLPPDVAHAPYPVSIMVHGTAAFRVTSLAQMDHWASRGFVVLAADHPGMCLSDNLSSGGPDCSGSGIPQDNLHNRDVAAEIAALGSPTGEWAFLSGIADATKISVSGHSQGGGYAEAASTLPGVQLVQIWDAPDVVGASANMKGALYIGGQSDAIIPYASLVSGYTGSGVTPKHLFGILNTGHLGVTSLCGGRNSAGEDAIQVGNHYGVCPTTFAFANILWDCSERYIAQDVGDHIVNTLTTTALEETLKGLDRTKQWADIKAHTDWGDYQESL